MVANRSAAWHPSVGSRSEGLSLSDWVSWVRRLGSINRRGWLVVAAMLAGCDGDRAGCHGGDHLRSVCLSDWAYGCGSIGGNDLGLRVASRHWWVWRLGRLAVVRRMGNITGT